MRRHTACRCRRHDGLLVGARCDGGQRPAAPRDAVIGAQIEMVSRASRAGYIGNVGKIGRLHDNFGILSSLVTDGEGGFITAWLDSRVGCDVYAQRIDSAGEVRWNSNGLRVAAAAAPGTGRLPLLASDESSNAILAWIDTRTGSPLDIDSWDIFATRISSSGAVPSPRIPSAINLETPWPNPTRESSTVWLELAHSQPVRVRVLDAAGRVVRKLSSETRPAGRTVIQWDGRDEDGRDVRQGLYFIQTRVEEGEASARIVVVR